MSKSKNRKQPKVKDFGISAVIGQSFQIKDKEVEGIQNTNVLKSSKTTTQDQKSTSTKTKINKRLQKPMRGEGQDDNKNKKTNSPF